MQLFLSQNIIQQNQLISFKRYGYANQGKTSEQIEEVITKTIRNIPNVTTTTTLSIIPEQGGDNE